MVEHTPGPWKVGHANWERTPVIVAKGAKQVCTVDGKYSSEANARLIAAAPSLLEALEVCVHELTVFAALLHDESTRAEIEANIAKARAAISLARGAGA